MREQSGCMGHLIFLAVLNMKGNKASHAGNVINQLIK